MTPKASSQPTGSLFTRFSFFLKAMWVFFPGIIFLIAGMFVFVNLSQGKDIIYQSTDGHQSWKAGLYLVLAAIFWVFTTWYTARLIAYNRNDLYEKAAWVLYHFPRLLGFCIFLVLWVAVFLIDDLERQHRDIAWLVTGIDLIIYAVFHHFLERSLTGHINAQRRKLLIVARWLVRAMLFLSCILVIIQWKNNNVAILLYTLPLFQLGFLFLVIVRHPLYKSGPDYKKKVPKARHTIASGFWNRYIRWAFADASSGFDFRFEKPIFIVYHLLAAAALLSYLLSVNHLPFAREVKSFPLVLLAFGILLGIVNWLSLLSYRRQVNFNFLIIIVVVIAGFFFETHTVRLKPAVSNNIQVYENRFKFRTYLESWIRWHRQALDTVSEYPVFLTLADGGASRSGYWAASVLARLHEKTRYGNSNQSHFLDHLFCLSGASGGSVGNAVFVSSLLIQQQYPGLKTDTLCEDYLGNDFLVYPLARILGPELVKPVFGWISNWGDRATALEIGMEYPDQKDDLMAGIIRGNFSRVLPTDHNRLPILSINVTRVNNGGPGVISSIDVDSLIFGERIDVLDLVPKGKEMRLSTAMVLGARFPFMSPGGKLGNSYFADGGYFDNSGAGTVHEMLLELNRIANSTDTLSAIVRKLQFYVIHLSNTPYDEEKASDRIHPTVNDLAAPLITLAGSYNSQTSVNDARLINYLKEINKERTSYIKLNLYREDTLESLSMNWVISDRARNIMRDRKNRKPAIDTLIGRLLRGHSSKFLAGLQKDN